MTPRQAYLQASAGSMLMARSRDQWQLAIATLVPNLNLGSGLLIYRRNALSLETRLAVAK